MCVLTCVLCNGPSAAVAYNGYVGWWLKKLGCQQCMGGGGADMLKNSLCDNFFLEGGTYHQIPHREEHVWFQL